jgi:hypothetical protein
MILPGHYDNGVGEQIPLFHVADRCRIAHRANEKIDLATSQPTRKVGIRSLKNMYCCFRTELAEFCNRPREHERAGERHRSDVDPSGFFINCVFYPQPTLFTETTNQMRIAREEIFGPVVSVTRQGPLRIRVHDYQCKFPPALIRESSLWGRGHLAFAPPAYCRDTLRGCMRAPVRT